MLELFALVDYFNVAPLRRGSTPTYADHLAAVEALVESLVKATGNLAPRPEELRIRLYGGWHSAVSDGATEAGEILSSIARKYFPTRRPLRLFLQLADSLLALPEDLLPHTLRYWRGLQPFSLNSVENTCPLEPSSCPLHALEKWRRGKCPMFESCQVRTSDVADSIRQKLVDTSLVADVITLAHESEAWIAAVSNDDDILPGALVASRYNSRTLLVRYNRLSASPYDYLLERRGIKYFDLRD